MGPDGGDGAVDGEGEGEGGVTEGGHRKFDANPRRENTGCTAFSVPSEWSSKRNCFG